MKRREFIGYTAIAGAGLMIDERLAWAQGSRTPGATVETSAGRVRGYVENTVQVFKGVPYGASTAGQNRFMPPEKPQPWTGVKEAVAYGPRAPQIVGGEPAEMLPTDPREAQGEDCLVLNIWTPKAARGQKKPVMLWFHGGGFANGSGSYGIYSGQELARKHDVVAISCNHRLNIFGYLYLAEFGGKWARASNAGILDGVRALEWIKENIDAFGGDPNNVTIFGQSGGGGKVSTLMAMPAAKGLFHRAIVESGANVTGIPKAQAVRTTEQVLQKLNVKPDQLDQLQKLPVQALLDAIRPPQGAPAIGGGLNFGPVVDGASLPRAPFDPSAPSEAASVPFLTGTNGTEVTFFTADAQLMPIDDATFVTRVKDLLKVDDAKAKQVIALYRKNEPGRDNIDLFLRMSTDGSFFRSGVDTQAERKAAQKGAPVYVYRFEYYSPVRGGRLKAMHCMEIPFVFDNLEAGKIYTGTSPAAQKLADQMSAAWVAFARTGNPNHKGMPQWTAFNTSDRPTMVFSDKQVTLVNDPGHEERLALKAIRDGAQARRTAE